MLINFAHAFGARYELPLPLLLFVVGGAGVVFLSFLLVMQRRVNKQAVIANVDEPYISNFSAIPEVLSYLILAALIFFGFAGSQEVAENFLPVFFWLVVWVVIPLSCGLIGDWTQKINPFANIAKRADSSMLRRKILGRREATAWPKGLGWWVAGALYFALACGELIFNQSATNPFNLALMLLMYFFVSAIMGMIYGSGWLKRGEIFSVLYYTWGKLGYFRFGNQGEKSFAGGLANPFDASYSRILFVILLLASISFDGLLSTPLWNNFQHKLPANWNIATLSYQLTAMLAFIILIALLYLLFTMFAKAVAKAGSFNINYQKALAGLLPSVLPISFGYLLAHYLEYLVVNSQLFFPLIGNPIGKESWPVHLPNPFNDSFEPKIHLLPSAFYWYFAVLVIVTVHIVAVVLAHRHLSSATANHNRARRSEYPWILAMVAYTMLSLWLLAQPLVKEKAPDEESFTPQYNQIEFRG
jgi:hypothetical protein